MTRNRQGISAWFAFCAAVLIIVTGGAAWAQQRLADSPTIRIVIFGDNLISGFQLKKGEDFASQLEAYGRSKGYPIAVTDMSRAAQTTHDASFRIDEVLALKPDIAIVSLGYNDFLQQFDITEVTAKNLNSIVYAFWARDIKVVVIRASPPANVRKKMIREYDSIFQFLAYKYEVPCYPSLQEGIEGNPAMTIGDRFHPNAKGVRYLVGRIYPYVQPLVQWKVDLHNYNVKQAQ